MNWNRPAWQLLAWPAASVQLCSHSKQSPSPCLASSDHQNSLSHRPSQLTTASRGASEAWRSAGGPAMILKAALLPVPSRDRNAKQSPPLGCETRGPEKRKEDEEELAPQASVEKRAGPAGRQLVMRGDGRPCGLLWELFRKTLKRCAVIPRSRPGAARVRVPKPLRPSYHLCHFEQGALGARVHPVQQSLRGLAWPRRAAAAARGSDEPRSMRHRGGPDRPAAYGPPRPLASKAGTGRGGASGAGRSGPSSQLWLDPEGTREQMPRKLLPTRLAEVGLAWAGNRTPGAVASPRSAPPRSQLVTSLQGFLCEVGS